jgi:predicted DNA-binding ribbon-helix-helix protein
VISNFKDGEIQLASADRPPAAEYWVDFYSWLMEQAAHLRAGRWEALDVKNLAEEIESLGRGQFNKLESALRVVMMHMLKWDYQPQQRGRCWMLSIKGQRLELEDVLAQLSQLALWNGDFGGCRGKIVSRNKGAWWQILCSVDQVSFG